jgi:hypothetical protein
MPRDQPILLKQYNANCPAGESAILGMFWVLVFGELAVPAARIMEENNRRPCPDFLK